MIVTFLITLLIGSVYVFLGTMGSLMAWSQTIREQVVSFIALHWLLFMFISLALLAFGIALAVYCLLTVRHKYYRVQGGNKQVLMDQTVIHSYLDSYWKKLFPEKEVPYWLKLMNNKIHIQANLPFVPLEDQKEILQQIDADLTQLFETVLGYKQDFLLSIRFGI